MRNLAPMSSVIYLNAQFLECGHSSEPKGLPLPCSKEDLKFHAHWPVPSAPPSSALWGTPLTSPLCAHHCQPAPVPGLPFKSCRWKERLEEECTVGWEWGRNGVTEGGQMKGKEEEENGECRFVGLSCCNRKINWDKSEIEISIYILKGPVYFSFTQK